MPDSFTDAALLLVGHGSTQNADSGAPVFHQAAELRRRGLFAVVREGFWKQDPRLLDVVPQISQPRVFIVPIFISEGYFSEEVIPRALGFHLDSPGESGRLIERVGQRLFYCRSVGSHESLAGVLLARARQVVGQFPFPRAPKPQDTTLFIAGHGTEQNENSRKAIEWQAELVRAQNIYAGVHAVFLEEEPRVTNCYQMAQTRNIVVVPFFISEGLHVQEDIPVLLGESERLVQQRLQSHQPTWRNPTEKHGKLVWFASSIGTEPMLAEVILKRVREAAQWGRV